MDINWIFTDIHGHPWRTVDRWLAMGINVCSYITKDPGISMEISGNRRIWHSFEIWVGKYSRKRIRAATYGRKLSSSVKWEGKRISNARKLWEGLGLENYLQILEIEKLLGVHLDR